MNATVFALAIVLCAACRSSQPQPVAGNPGPLAQPATAEACKACNGVWGRQGLSQKEICNCRTKDAGKACKAKKDCESQCVAKDTPDTEVTDQGPPAKGYFLGTCHDFAQYFGCGRLLPDSAAQAPVVLSELPPKICID